MVRRFGLLLAPLALLAACAGTERTDLLPPPTTFALLDANGDGAITAEEWELHGSMVFLSLDANGDQKVTNKEMGRGYAAFDADRNGSLTREEFDMPLIDLDRDGVITEKEWHDHLIVDGLAFQRDGSVSAQSFRVRRKLLFDSLDSNATGQLTAEDLREDTPGFTLMRL